MKSKKLTMALIAIAITMVVVVELNGRVIRANQPTTTAAIQASYPATHWGAMQLNTNQGNCLGRATKAMDDAGLADRTDNGWERYGRTQNATVLVICAPASNNASNLWVVASSPDSRAAELLRNDIRTRIANMREL